MIPVNLPHFPTLVTPTTTEVVLIAQRVASAMGPAYDFGDESILSAELWAYAFVFYEVQNKLRDTLKQAFPTTVLDLISQLESYYGVPVSPLDNIDKRRERLIAKLKSRLGASTQAILDALSFFVNNNAVVEVSVSAAVTAGDNRAVYQWGLVIGDANFDDSILRGTIERIVKSMQPAHVRCNIAATKQFFTDGFSGSFTDRTLIGG